MFFISKISYFKYLQSYLSIKFLNLLPSTLSYYFIYNIRQSDVQSSGHKPIFSQDITSLPTCKFGVFPVTWRGKNDRQLTYNSCNFLVPISGLFTPIPLWFAFVGGGDFVVGFPERRHPLLSDEVRLRIKRTKVSFSSFLRLKFLMFFTLHVPRLHFEFRLFLPCTRQFYSVTNGR